MIRMWGLVVLLAFAATSCSCERKPPTAALLKEGEPCDNDDRCETGLCDGPGGENAVCVRRCSDGCNANEVCVQLTPNRFSCQPDKRQLCAPCAADSACPYPSDKCILVNNEKVCGRDCAFDQNCPSGYRCVNAVGVDGQSKIQQCVPIVASCACLARGDFMQQCEVSNTLGTCFGVKECDLVLNEVVCSAAEPVAETCNGLDDDCDGQIDEGQMTETCGVGECARTMSACIDGGIVMCTPGEPIAELCNGKDDDCDGVDDNGFELMTDVMNCGACGNVCNLPHASSTCGAGTCRVDTCNPGWSNCNGLDPDGCESDVTSDPNNCGACNDTCTRPNSTATCVNSTCQFACAPGFIDLNQDPSDGCEYACTFVSATDLPDLAFVDANCDGIDGELNNAIFVSPTGVDSAAGTRAAPKRTIAAALSAATSEGKRDIYVAHGGYTGPLNLTGIFSALNVAGGYHPTTWQRAQNLAAEIQGGNPALLIDSSNDMLVQLLKFQGADGTAGNASTYGAKIVESSGVKLEGVELRAGNALGGVDGQSQPAAASGTAGSNGREGCYHDPRFDPPDYIFACNFGLIHRSCTSGNPGAAGATSACGAPGGNGGAASRYNTPTTPNGSPGSTASAGGAGGTGVPPGTTPGAGSPFFGVDGAAGSSGNNGSAAPAGSFNSLGFTLGAATNGTSGTAGRGGGGGGGGAGGLGPPAPFYGGFTCYSYGSAGSGGGSGGCGGNAGTAGTSGGASIGLFLFNAQVTGQNVSIRPGNGGRGGNGGSGGAGGTGGLGGTSAYDSQQGAATRAGGGGRGGNGGAGGHGGGGAGGPVYGIAKNASSAWSTTGGSVMLGTPGAGGTSPGNSGPAGASGIQTTF